MNNTSLELVEKLVHEKKYDTIQEFVSIAHMGKKPLCFREYTGTEVRGFEENGNVELLIPEKITAVQESALAKAITSGSIFDDAETASNCGTYIRLTIIPARAFAKTNPVDLPKCLGTLTKACVGQMDSDGRLPCSQACVDNGANFERDILTSGDSNTDIGDIVRHHLSIPDEEENIPMFLGKAVHTLKKEVPKIVDFKADDTLDDDDYVEIDPTADAEENTHSIEENEAAAKIADDMDKSFGGEDSEALPDADDPDAKEAAEEDRAANSGDEVSSDDDSDEGDDSDDDDDDDDDYDEDDVDDYEECGTVCAPGKTCATQEGMVFATAKGIRKKFGKKLKRVVSDFKKLIKMHEEDRLTRGKLLSMYEPIEYEYTSKTTFDNSWGSTSYGGPVKVSHKSDSMDALYVVYDYCNAINKKKKFTNKFEDDELDAIKKIGDALDVIIDDLNSIVKDPDGFDKNVKSIIKQFKIIIEEAGNIKFEQPVTESAKITYTPYEEKYSEVEIEEGFISRRPKKLKPLPARDIVAYITVEMNAIRDSNDQAMLAGYTCSKLELCDFYINCIDTQDDRYVVPHDRAYLVRFQTDLNRLLTQILAIKPINKQDRIWKVNVNYPEGWRG